MNLFHGLALVGGVQSLIQERYTCILIQMVMIKFPRWSETPDLHCLNIKSTSYDVQNLVKPRARIDAIKLGPVLPLSPTLLRCPQIV